MDDYQDPGWASHDATRIRLADLFHTWRTLWDELQQQRTGGPQAHRDLIAQLLDVERQIEEALPARTAPPA